MKASGVRARVRAEMIDELKAVARRHLATDGANLSLRAVARDMGMASSAVYRYFASRDELLTALIIDAYESLAGAAEKAHDAAPANGYDRWLALCRAVREWALADPHQWALIYGSPVPGYSAPVDTISPATRVILLIGRTLFESWKAGDLVLGEAIEGRYAEELARVAAFVDPEVPARLVADTITMFIQLLGAVSAELFGQLANSVDADRPGFFKFQMRAAAKNAGLNLSTERG